MRVTPSRGTPRPARRPAPRPPAASSGCAESSGIGSRPGSPPPARASSSSDSSVSRLSSRSDRLRPDCAAPRTSPSRRCLRSSRASFGPVERRRDRLDALVGRRCPPRRRCAAGTSLARRPGRPGRAAGAAGRCRSGRRRGSPSPRRSGTSTPTSTIVVATSTAVSPRTKRRHRGVLLLGGQPAVQHVDGQTRERTLLQLRQRCRGRRAAAAWRLPSSSTPRSAPASSSSAGLVPDARADDERLVTGGHLLPDLRPRSASASRGGATWLLIGVRPAGSSVSVLVSRSPKTVIATVRGIGVAVITSRCGGLRPLPSARSRSASRCSTPNRCCSSTTTRPRSANCTPSLQQRVRADDDARRCRPPPRAAPCAGRAVLCEPVSRTTFVADSAAPSVPASARSPEQRRGGCAGAGRRAPRSARAAPPGHRSRPRSASPAARPPSCRNRPRPGAAAASDAGGRGRRRCARPTFRWPSVSVKGSDASKAASRPSARSRARDRRCPFGGEPPLGQRDLQDERLVPLEPLPAGGGVGRVRRAGGPAGRPARGRPARSARRMSDGSGSGSGPSTSSTTRTALAIVFDSPSRSPDRSGPGRRRSPPRPRPGGRPRGWSSAGRPRNWSTLPENIAVLPTSSFQPQLPLREERDLHRVVAALHVDEEHVQPAVGQVPRCSIRSPAPRPSPSRPITQPAQVGELTALM